jgi:TRAP transporter TAXI family solute receptor
MFSPKSIAIFALSLLASIALALHYLVPAPPRKIVIATGSQTGQYFRLGNEFKAELEKNGIAAEILVTKGSIENLELLNDPKSKVDLAFVQSGTASSKEYPQLQSLAGVFYEPLWVIYNAKSFTNSSRPPNKIEDLINKRVSIGLPGSGTRKLVEHVFLLDQIKTQAPNFLELGTDQSLEKLKLGEIDAMFITVNNRAQIMQKVFSDPDLKIMSFSKAYGYPPRIKGISVLTVRRATLDIMNDSPDRDILLLTSTAELVSKKDLHPAISSLIMDFSGDLLSKADILSDERTFPSPNHLSFDINDDAQKVMRDGPSFLHRYLPFWVAVWVDRLIRVFIPLLAILIPLFNFLPSILEYRTKFKFAAIYKELRKVESRIQMGNDDLSLINKELDELLQRTMRLKVSQFNTKDIYDLLAHIGDVQRRIEEGKKIIE